MQIIELELTNFKGVHALRLNLNGADAKISGDNATGKTTIMDAFIWLLTGKDHLGRSDMNFNIKTLDSTGAAIPMIDHSVRGKLEHDGAEFELIRNFKEVWQKRTGTNVQTFNGHKTEYYIDGVPKTEKEYNAFIERIAPPALLNLLIIHTYFNEQIKAEERRKILLEMCGDVDESEMLSLPEWAEFALHITRMVSVADLKKAKTAQKSKINEEIKSIPVEINVHTKYMDIDGLDAEKERVAVSTLTAQINAYEEALAGLNNGGTVSRLRKELAELETEQIKANSEASQKTNAATEALREEYQRGKEAQQKILLERVGMQAGLDTAQIHLSEITSEKEALLKKYWEIEGSVFSGDLSCPTCGQALPAHQVEGAKAQFNENKAKQLEDISSKGKCASAEIERLEGIISRSAASIAELDKDAEAIGNKLTRLTEKISSIKPASVNFAASRIDAKKNEIASITASGAGKEAELRSRTAELKNLVSEHERNISRLQNAENAARDIEALKSKEKELTAAYEECEGIIAMCDDFTNARVKMLDERISGFFSKARFKLTETLVNGGLREICDTLVDGVPYSAANNAARINVGLDIISSFSQHYGVSLPVFIDNAESITALDHIDTQVIRLIVSEYHSTLHIEKEE